MSGKYWPQFGGWRAVIECTVLRSLNLEDQVVIERMSTANFQCWISFHIYFFPVRSCNKGAGFIGDGFLVWRLKVVGGVRCYLLLMLGHLIMDGLIEPKTASSWPRK